MVLIRVAEHRWRTGSVSNVLGARAIIGNKFTKGDYRAAQQISRSLCGPCSYQIDTLDTWI
jgi:hypothetical protein